VSDETTTATTSTARRTVEEQLRAAADRLSDDPVTISPSELHDALNTGAKTLDLLVHLFYVGHIGQCEWNRPYPTGTEPRCTCGLNELLHGEARPQDKHQEGD
jgi:hypothetical protein